VTGIRPEDRFDPAEEKPSSSAKLVAFLERQPRWRITALGLSLLGGLWVIDRSTAPDVSFLVFYLAPVLLLTWFEGRRAGMLVSLASAVLWFLDDVLTGPVPSRPLTPYWNAAVKLGFFLFVVYILASLKAALERQRQAERERMELELAMAEQVQRGLFPQKLPPVPGLDYFGICRPAAAVGGDYYDFVPLGPEKLGIAVGDISGKGLSAALLMASLQGSLRSSASPSEGDEARTIDRVNRQLCGLIGPSRFATLFWGVYDWKRRELAYVNAGHNPPMLLRRASLSNGHSNGHEPAERLTVGGTVLGMFPEAAFRSGVVKLEPGDCVGLFSDGISEAPDGADVEFGERRLEGLLREGASLSAADLCDRVFAEVQTYLRGRPNPDDLTIVVLKAIREDR
jgi:serine phosphatase RsbU (regulator of sigma subunit)